MGREKIDQSASLALHTCSTFVLSGAGYLLVGHNLNDYIPVPGLVFINQRGITKHNIHIRFFYPSVGNFYRESVSCRLSNLISNPEEKEQ